MAPTRVARSRPRLRPFTLTRRLAPVPNGVVVLPVLEAETPILPPEPSEGIVGSAAVAAIALAGCGEQEHATSAAKAAIATVGSGSEASSPSSATAGYPSSMAVLGHSGATGEDSDPSKPHVEIRANSWATGTNPAVKSVYLRILAKNPAIKDHNFNLAEAGATVDRLIVQTHEAVALTPKPQLFLVQITDNDIVCPAHASDYAGFRTKLLTALGILHQGAPNARMFLVSQWGSPPT